MNVIDTTKRLLFNVLLVGVCETIESGNLAFEIRVSHAAMGKLGYDEVCEVLLAVSSDVRVSRVEAAKLNNCVQFNFCLFDDAIEKHRWAIKQGLVLPEACCSMAIDELQEYVSSCLGFGASSSGLPPVFLN